MADLDLRERLVADLRRHPRVAYQNFCGSDVERRALAQALPAIVPFRGKPFANCLWVLDWDHRLPSKGLVLRFYGYYSTAGYEDGVRAFDDRTAQIAREDLFPEFDVSDYAGLKADEAYEGEMEVGATPAKFRLVSDWRRQIEADVARKAEAIVRGSAAFKSLSVDVKTRPMGLGDLEAAEWAPPSETGHARWGVEVWYLRSFNGMIGEGTAFLVDVEDQRVVSQRDFQFRAG
jgi:hypothetical protein